MLQETLTTMVSLVRMFAVQLSMSCKAVLMPKAINWVVQDSLL